ncbi:hypothetical protein VP01_709g2 [Puccinia sorghi]|uniref:Uncharacterized protein n=1 Tax=Puccinia sorghi TaxID=27349 RepID=A0A0L6UDJ7_9BASI|nr:hypothetical protein VP01_709g2 [Puccinia sorghi]
MIITNSHKTSKTRFDGTNTTPPNEHLKKKVGLFRKEQCIPICGPKCPGTLTPKIGTLKPKIDGGSDLMNCIFEISPHPARLKHLVQEHPFLDDGPGLFVLTFFKNLKSCKERSLRLDDRKNKTYSQVGDLLDEVSVDLVPGGGGNI